MLRDYNAEQIRAKVVEYTTSKAEYFAKLGIPVKVGDPVLVKNCCRIKIRLDGTRLLIPPKEGHNHGKFIYRAIVH
jgi:co-chaperonin GroES (HSP10)